MTATGRWPRQRCGGRAALLPTKPAPSAFERAVLAVVSPGSMLAPRELGLVCALVMVYRRRRASSHHLVQPGARVRVTVLAEKVTPQRSARHGTAPCTAAS